MIPGADEADRLAARLAETDFDAVERNGYRAEWTADGERVRVSDLATDEEVFFGAEDLVRAESDREIRNARKPGPDGQFGQSRSE